MRASLNTLQPVGLVSNISASLFPTTLHSAAVEELRRRIVTGELAPGAALKDTEIAAQMGLSNTPVREAFVKLAGEGLVEIIPNKSKRVTPINCHAMVDLLMVQNHLWELGYEWGGKNIGENELAQLKQILDTHRLAMSTGDVHTAVNAGLEFDLVLMAASGNQELVRVSVDRMPLIQRFVILKMPWLPSDEMLAIHEHMYEEFLQRKPKNAIALFRQTSGAFLKDVMKLRDNELC